MNQNFEEDSLSRKELANALRVLAIDAIETANSGHPGAPMGMADMAEALWRGHFKHNPANPNWADRDRFVLSNGHASMLLYGLLHLSGYDLSIEDIKNFRKLDSKTPGHPEYGHTPGIETTTGPLGQGLAMAVGMALAEKKLAATFNRSSYSIVDHYTYVFAGDGCLMEGLSQEACSLAGTLKLNKLIVLYDDNGISIDGKVQEWFTDDTPARFASMDWHVVRDVNGHDSEALDAALTLARATKDKPSLICCKTIIGYGSPNKSGTSACHGSALGSNEAMATRLLLGWEEEPFVIPQKLYAAWDAKAKGAAKENAWNELFASYKVKYPELAAEFERRLSGSLPVGFLDKAVEDLAQKKDPQATRVASGEFLSLIGTDFPELLGGSADLTGSVNTWHKNSVKLTASNITGNHLSYGVREFAMGCIMNGVALHRGFIPYGGTFLVFSDYMRSAIRLSALMKQRVIWVLTHDSIGLGEDGPTHQPVEHIPSLRLIPDLQVWRPADALETAIAWKNALEHQHGPTALVLSRQNLPQLSNLEKHTKAIAQGGYLIYDCKETPEAILISTGSELHLAVQAAEKLEQSGHKVNVVSMPCTEIFDKQSADIKQRILPDNIKNRVVIEASAPDLWYKYVGLDGKIIGMNSFGASAPAKDLFKHFGFTVENIIENVLAMLKK